MKTNSKAIKIILLMYLFLCNINAFAQGPYPKTGDHQVCINSIEPYGVALTVGSTYLWRIVSQTGGNGTITPGSSSNLITVNWTAIGTAILQVIETNINGCVGDTVFINIIVNALPTVTVNSPTICASTVATVTATPNTAGTYTYAWTVPSGATNPGNVASFTTNIAGVYSVVITNSLGCVSNSASGTVTVTAAPNLVINNPSIACLPATVDLTKPAITLGSTAGLTFTYWTDAAATISYPTPTTASAGTYYIKGDLGSGCFSIKPVIVTQAPTPIVKITTPPSICVPNKADLTDPAIVAGSTTGLTYSYWLDALATLPVTTPTAVPAGTYYIKGTTAAGCYDIEAVVVPSSPAATLIITNPAAVCAPNKVDITAPSITAGSTSGLVLSYWQDAAATISLASPTAAPAGTYYIKGLAAGGCYDIKPVTVIVNPIPTPNINGPSTACVSIANASLTYTTPLIAGNSYNWVVTNGNIITGQGSNSITISWITAGTGTVSVTESIPSSGCVGNNLLSITINPKPITSAITHN